VGPLISNLLGPLTSLISKVGGLGGALKFLTGPVGIIITIFTTLMAVSPQFRQAVMGLATALIQALWPAFKAIFAALQPPMPIIVMLAKQVGSLLAPVIKALTPLLLQLTPLIAVLAQLLGKVLGVVLLIIGPVLRLAIALEKWLMIKLLIPVINVL